MVTRPQGKPLTRSQRSKGDDYLLCADSGVHVLSFSYIELFINRPKLLPFATISLAIKDERCIYLLKTNSGAFRL